jgi:hypothetical protein
MIYLSLNKHKGFYMADNDKETISDNDRKKPVFRLEDLKETPTRTPEEIRADVQRRMAEGRFAEMTPGQAGIDEDA